MGKIKKPVGSPAQLWAKWKRNYSFICFLWFTFVLLPAKATASIQCWLCITVKCVKILDTLTKTSSNTFGWNIHCEFYVNLSCISLCPNAGLLYTPLFAESENDSLISTMRLRLEKPRHRSRANADVSCHGTEATWCLIHRTEPVSRVILIRHVACLLFRIPFMTDNACIKTRIFFPFALLVRTNSSRTELTESFSPAI